MVKHLPTMWETWVQSLGWEDPLEEEMVTHSSILAWKIPWTEEPGRLQTMGSQRFRHDWASSLPFPSLPFIHFQVLWQKTGSSYYYYFYEKGLTSTYVYLILAWSPRNWMDILSHSASVRLVSLPCEMERVMPLHPVPRVPNVCSQKQQVHQLLRLPFVVTTVQVPLFQVRSLLLEESDLFPKWFLRLSLAVPLPFCLGPCFTLGGERNTPIGKT